MRTQGRTCVHICTSLGWRGAGGGRGRGEGRVQGVTRQTSDQDALLRPRDVTIAPSHPPRHLALPPPSPGPPARVESHRGYRTASASLSSLSSRPGALAYGLSCAGRREKNLDIYAHTATYSLILTLTQLHTLLPVPSPPHFSLTSPPP